jgi:nicotinate-nucleotide adenylyltransferase
MPGALQRLGVLGGSFNPPHLGHLVIASEAHWLARLDRVLFVPAADPPHKRIADGVPAAARLRLTRAAVAGDRRFEVCDIEIERCLRYTVDTLQVLHELYAESTLVFIAGSDSLLALQSWHEPDRILTLCELAVAPRPEDDEAAVRAAAARWGPAVTVLPSARVGISSTDVRARLRAGHPVDYLVPEAVRELIVEEGWYRGDDQA